MYSSHSKHWQLNTDITYLNHGSFGATPTIILEKQQFYRNEMEKNAVDFFLHRLPLLYNEAKESLGQFIGTSKDNLVFVQNTTTGVNTILNALPTNENDEWLTLNIAYGACVHALHHYATLKKVKVNVAEIPYPVYTNEEIVTAIEKAITPRTTFAMIDYVTSSTGFILPIKEIIELLHSKNIEVLVDAAHAPGMIPFDIDTLQAEYVVGNCHKWICSPKGSAFMYVAPRCQYKINALIISHYNEEGEGTASHWSNQFMWDGTHDYSQYLCVKQAIAFFDEIVGWENLQTYNHHLVWQAGNVIADTLHVKIPVAENMVGSLLNIPLPNSDTIKYKSSMAFKQMLFDKYKIEVPIFVFPKVPIQWLRISAQWYNSIDQYVYLADCLKKEL